MGALPSHISVSGVQSLNASVGGRLHVGVPFARPCFEQVAQGVAGTQDNAACTQVISNYSSPAALLSNFGAYSNTAWETCQATSEQCLLDFSNASDPSAFSSPRTCAQGSVPNYYIDVQNAQDVSVAFNFSRVTGVPLVIKNKGHEYMGRSSGPGTLALWVNNIQGISYDASFVPQECNQDGVPAVTFGAGVSLGSLYEFADANNITILGGTDESIAAGGGYLMGGGHSIFSNSLGLAVDQVLQFEIVTPDGQRRIANSCVNSDLFFALRGGGGGTFGVVLQVTTKALPRLTFPVVRTAFNGVPSVEVQTKYLQFLIDNALPLASKGWGGYIEPGLGLTFVNPFVSLSEANETMEALQQLVLTQLNGTFLLQEETSWLPFFNEFIGPTSPPDGVPEVIGSRLIPATVFDSESQRAELLDILMAGNQKHQVALFFAVAPFFYKDDGETSLNPAWRSSLWHVVFADFWDFNTTASDRAQIYTGMDATLAPLRQLAPQPAAYLNEAYLFEPDFSETFWGSNYARLLAIKEKYDPHHLLDCWRCVGWQGPSASRFACYP